MRYYYKRVEDKIIVGVEAKSLPSVSPGFVEATKEEYNCFIASLPVIDPELIIFTPINPHLGVEQRLTHVEQFLQDRYPPP